MPYERAATSETDEAFALLSDSESDGFDRVERWDENERSDAEPDRERAQREPKPDLEPDSPPDPENARKARLYIEAEHALTPGQAVRLYPMAIFWCLVAAACVIMEGYDTILIGNFYAYPAFATKYGQFVDEHGQHQLSAPWQAVLGNSASIGCVVGVLLNGHLVDRFGQKPVLLGALGVLSLTVFLTFFAPNIEVLMLGELLCGLPWGVFASSAPAYASEVLPLCLRVYLTSYTNMCFIVGQLIAAAVLAALVQRRDDWSFRIPFALQWLWPAVIAPVLVFAPESPWHLVRHGRLQAAEKSLRRLQRTKATTNPTSQHLNPSFALAHMVQTDALERKILPGTSYRDCFRGTERRRTEIACMAFAGQVLAGSSFAYNSTYFFQQVGLDTDRTYLLNTAGTVLSLLGTLVNWVVLMPVHGRRRIYLWGMATMSILLTLVGLLSFFPSSSSFVGLLQAALTLAWTFVFQLSVGQLGWAIPAEVGSTRLRQKTVCLARNTYYLASITANVVNPFLINPGQLNLKGFTGFVWAFSAALVWLWAYFRLPETKGRTYEELDRLFAQNTPTRQFATTHLGRPVSTTASTTLYDYDHVHDTDYDDGLNEANFDEDAHEMDAMVHRG